MAVTAGVTTTPGRAAAGWRVTLGVVGAVLVVIAVVLELVTANFHTVTVVTADTATGVTKTVASPGPPSSGLVTACLTVGVVCLLVSAFWNRITKLVVAGVEIDLSPENTARLAGKALAKVGGNAEKFQPVLAGAIRALATGRVTHVTTQMFLGPTALAHVQTLDETFDQAVDIAFDEYARSRRA